MQDYFEYFVNTNVLNELKAGNSVLFHITFRLGDKEFQLELRYIQELFKPSQDEVQKSKRSEFLCFEFC
jgi:chemotaxis signal transduction protein